MESPYENWRIDDIEMVVDAGWAQGGQLNPDSQQVLFQTTNINSVGRLPLPSRDNQPVFGSPTYELIDCSRG